MTQERLKVAFPSQGWKQILTGRKGILDAYDKAREQARAHEVETYHGRVAEGALRKWLGGFLPKRYGVTSGYVVSPGLPSDEKVPHYDIIIYDQMEAPVLWIEDNPDSSQQGRSLAIPVEYALAVLEVKASLTSGNVKEAITHLHDLAPLMQAVDGPDERYKLHLPPRFCCGAVFVELREDVQYSEAALSSFLSGIGLRGFFGGVVLRATSHTNPLPSGRITLLQSDQPLKSTVKDRSTPLGEFGMCQSVTVADGVHIGAMIMWTEATFAQFAFDLVAMIQGKYEPGRVSSFYGLGSSFHELMRAVGAKEIPAKET
jgi:Domain of unknown function (DUF6602)